jgi:UDP-N-acetylmuramoyl-L-alanyl-D-glutamate--2,6-diaminopimelate ligase
MMTLRVLKNYAHKQLALGANILYRFPSNSLNVVGVTGTDGKTTTSNLIYHILRHAGKKVAVISTVGAVIDDKKFDTGFHVTTPSPFSIQKYLRLARREGCTHVVLEVTSHAIDQNRVWGIKFDVGVLTNITHEHLDYHKTYMNYVHTKLRLFEASKVAVINSNGEWFGEVLKKIPKEKLVTYSLNHRNKEDISLASLPFKIKTSLIGDFNMENILAAYTTARILGITDKLLDEGIQSFELPPGRQEVLKSKSGVTIVIDFAHTPNSFEKILPEIRKMTAGKLIHVFGTAGERDRSKRPEMGKSASRYDDVIVLTAEDPRSESIEKINAHIKEGVLKEFIPGDIDTPLNGKVIYEINDRRFAIEFALSKAEKNDTVIITGKGHEASINYGNGEIPWSDKKAVVDYLKSVHEI